MIVRILSSSAAFHGVSYNTDKIDRGLGELMTVRNFGMLQGLQQLRPEDYKNELKAIAALNKRVKSPQFHAAISAPGKSFDKFRLTAIAEQWLTGMGYAKQPYLVVFHQDTANNHVHVVSTRIDREGKKINRDFEHIRAVREMNKVMGLEERQQVRSDIDHALSYRFGTTAQFRLILENRGYTLKEENGQLQVIKFGKRLADLEMATLQQKVREQGQEEKRPDQIRALLNKYARVYDSSLRKENQILPGGREGKPHHYTSGLAAYLRHKHGLELIFHASAGKPPYGYTIIDHPGKAAYKGSEIMPLKSLLAIKTSGQSPAEEKDIELLPESTARQKDYYSALLKAIIRNYPDIKEGLHHQGLDLRIAGSELQLVDAGASVAIPVSELLTSKDLNALHEEVAQTNDIAKEVNLQYHAQPTLNLASDIDDEAVLGRNRRRKKKARTNTR